mmetsp:Transcript_48384/g.134493  ORF Transcript_48384/g.134493 Transcript_48384/m.134493 type:complete len:513 (-) Transcript_48384:8-1546(-)
MQASGATARRYVVQFGNNSGLIRQLLRTRSGWAPAPGDPGNSAGNASYQEKRVKLKPNGSEPDINFLWTQYRCSAFLDAMAAKGAGVAVTLNEETRIRLKPVGKAAGRDVLQGTSEAPLRIHNHFEGSALLTTKRGICESMSSLYLPLGRDPFGAIPLTFIVRGGTTDLQFALWREAFAAFDAEAGQRIWLVKPGESGNRGCGIKIYDSIEEVAQRVDSKKSMFVIQKYIERPLLIHKRKFDIRAYCLVLQEPLTGALRAFCFRDAYLRTTSARYTTKTFDRMVHLNNDAVQKHGEDYGKFESANKMSLEEFQRYLDEHHAKDGVSVRQRLVPQIRGLMADAVRAVAGRINPRGLRGCFEVFGFDFMVDAGFRVWMIECNANPCLDLCSAYLSHVIPTMLDHALTLSVDRLCTGPGWRPPKAESDHGGEGGTKWDMIFDSLQDFPPSIACSWIEALPEGKDVDGTVVLGRQIICTKQPRAKHRKKAAVAASSPKGMQKDAASSLEDDEPALR